MAGPLGQSVQPLAQSSAEWSNFKTAEDRGHNRGLFVVQGTIVRASHPYMLQYLYLGGQENVELLRRS